ncbi:hypothetical protein IE53DRAFT_385622 [Violaceomyces palustris]|uniref:Uncharacterized protein n=1 Tax=Violaceomyces palustris TaxID=1673888 RepID=A0ACD0P1T2_9BASI|nr:hypothetical protein IE53DRAFT_385622 [Violaceomyces palustris]
MTSSSSDDEMVGVISVPATVPGTPFNISRPSSPPTFSTLSASHFSEEGRVEPNRTKTLDQDSGRIGSSSKAVGKQASSTTSKRKANANSASSSSSKYSRLDPLRAFNSEISQHIFLQLPQSALVSCSMVSKRWRRSATLNYCWYRLYQHTFNSHSVVDGPWQQPSLPAWGSGGAKWTRRESRTDWKTTFAKGRKMEAREQERYESLPGSGAVTPSRTQRMSEAGILTATEWREEQWRSQHEERWSKNEMREHYKSFSKGGKLKGKSAKGGVKTGSANDGSLWE